MKHAFGTTLRRLLAAASIVCIVLAAAYCSIGLMSSRFYDALNREIAPSNADPEERAHRTFELVSSWRYFDSSRLGSPFSRWLAEAEHRSPLHVSARAALTAGVDRIGPCGATSRSMVVLLGRARIPTRKAILYTDSIEPRHTVVEVFLDGEWRVFDPTYNWFWRRQSDGELATAADLRRDPELFATILARHPEYPIDEYHYRNVYHLRWEKLPGLPRVRELLRAAFGDAWVRHVGTPALYERPHFLSAVLFATAALASGVLRLLLGFHKPRPQRGTPARRRATRGEEPEGRDRLMLPRSVNTSAF